MVLAGMANEEAQLFKFISRCSPADCEGNKMTAYVTRRNVPAMRAGIPLDLQKVVHPLVIRKTDSSWEATDVFAMEIMRLQSRKVAPPQFC